MLDKKVGVAVVGLGFVGGQAHVPAVKKIDGAELTKASELRKILYVENPAKVKVGGNAVIAFQTILKI